MMAFFVAEEMHEVYCSFTGLNVLQPHRAEKGTEMDDCLQAKKR